MSTCVCGSTRSKEMYVSKGNPVLRCLNCGQVRIHLIVKPDYSFDYFAEKNNYYEKSAAFTRRFNELLDQIEQQVKPGSMLDVGAGSGLLVAAAKKRGWDASGIEYSTDAAAFARKELGLDIAAGDVFAAKGQYDVVILNHVLEHLDEPLANLKQAKSLIKPGGYLVIGVPNYGSIVARLRGKTWPSLKAEEHIWQFTKQGLIKMIAPLKLELVDFQTDNYRIDKPESLKQRLYKIQAPLTNAIKAGEGMTFVFKKH